MEHILNIDNASNNYKVYTLDVVDKVTNENVQLISSYDGENLQDNINAVIEIVNRKNSI